MHLVYDEGYVLLVTLLDDLLPVVLDEHELCVRPNGRQLYSLDLLGIQIDRWIDELISFDR